MKVLHLIRINGYGGAEKLLLQMLPAMARQAEVECLICYRKGSHEAAISIGKQLADQGIGVHFVSYKFLLSPSLLKEIRNKIRNGSFDIIHSHMKHADCWLAVLKATRNIRLPLVSTMHGYTDKYENKHGFNVSWRVYFSSYYWVTKLIYSQFQGFILISEIVSRFFRDIGMLKNKKQAIIYHGYEKPKEGRLEKGFNRPASLQIAVPGRLITRKGHHYMIEAFAKILPRYPDAELHFYGAGPEEDNLKKQTEQLEIQRKVIFHGYVDQLTEQLKKMNIVVVPSLWEAFGLVFLDAFAAEVPVVAFDLPAGNEIIVDGHTGLLAKPYSADSLAERIETLYSDTALQDRLVSNAKLDLDSKFNIDLMITKYVKFYRQILTNTNK